MGGATQLWPSPGHPWHYEDNRPINLLLPRHLDAGGRRKFVFAFQITYTEKFSKIQAFKFAVFETYCRHYPLRMNFIFGGKR